MHMHITVDRASLQVRASASFVYAVLDHICYVIDRLFRPGAAKNVQE
jgi:hypothetical protein